MQNETLEIVPQLRDDDLHTWHYVGTGDVLVVCFSPTGDADPQLPQEVSFPQVATDNGTRHVIFISDPQRTWLNAPGLREKIYFHVQKFKEQVKATEIVTLGHSMGGFYALACAADLDATAAVALSPQISVHPQIAGDDKRWMNFRDRITSFRYREVGDLITDGPQYFVVHGEMGREKPQRDRMPRAKNILHLILPEVHHNVPARLKREGLQHDFINACFAGDKAGATKLLQPLNAYKRTLKKQPELAPFAAPSASVQPTTEMRGIDHRSITYFFVMDGPAFEVPAMLLAQSIRDTLGNGPKIVAYVPHEKIDAVPRITRRMLDILRVDTRGFDTKQVDWNPAYPHGNKILASKEPRDTDLSVFLDTDVLCLKDPDFSLVTANTPLFATSEGVQTWGSNQDDWTAVYDMFDLPVPDWRVRLSKGRARIVIPYFNAGVVGFVENGNAARQRLPDLWFDTALAIDANPAIADKRPWLDQIALPVAAARMGGRTEVMSNLHNFSPYRLKGVEDIADVRLMHYRMPSHFRKYEACRQVTENLLAKCPDNLRGRLRGKLGVFIRGVDLPEHLLA